jgi:hypothetical protein
LTADVLSELQAAVSDGFGENTFEVRSAPSHTELGPYLTI